MALATEKTGLLAQPTPPTLSIWKQGALWLAHLLSFVSLGLTLWWIYGDDSSPYFLGGAAWTGAKLFGIHPMMMVGGLVVGLTQSLLAWRTYPLKRDITKGIHGFWAFASVAMTSVGLASIFIYHNHFLKPNLYSAHAWIGIAVVVLFYAHYLGGLFAFGFGCVSDEAKRSYMPSHRFMGIFVYIAAAFTCMTGIQDKNGQLGCGYNFTITEPDYNPAEHYKNLYLGCRISNGLCIAILATCLLATFAVMDMVGAPSSNGGAPVAAPVNSKPVETAV